jgi:hypothetical protein
MDSLNVLQLRAFDILAHHLCRNDTVWAQGGLNPWPTGYEPVALPG